MLDTLVVGWLLLAQELADIIRAHMGEQISPALR